MIRVSLAEIERVAHERPPGYLEEVLAAGELEEEFVVIPDAAYDALLKKFSGKTRPCGVGCQLKRILTSWGIEAGEGCMCASRAALMDKWGPDECYRRIPEIIGWLRDEAHFRGMLFSDIAAGQLIRMAIWRARRHARKLASEGT